MVIFGCVVLAMDTGTKYTTTTIAYTTTPTTTSSASAATTSTNATTTTVTTTVVSVTANTTEALITPGELGVAAGLVGMLECCMDYPWALLVWGAITLLLYGGIAWAGLDRDGSSCLGLFYSFILKH